MLVAEMEKSKLQLEELKKQCSSMLGHFLCIIGFIVSGQNHIFCFIMLEHVFPFKNIV